MIAAAYVPPPCPARGLGIALALALLAAAPAGAQVAGPVLRFLPRAGIFLQPGSLGDAPVATQIPGSPPTSRRARLGAGAVVGFGVVLDRGSGILLRGDVDWAPSLPVRFDDERSLFDATMSVITAGVMTRAPSTGALRPYVSAGLGVRSYTFEPWASAGTQLPEHRFDAAVRLGAGADLPLGPLTLTAEAHDLTSSFRFDEVQGAGGARKLQNDVAVTLGLRFDIR